MTIEREKAYHCWMIFDSDGYVTEVVVTESPQRPEVGARQVCFTSFINTPAKIHGNEFKLPTLGDIPISAGSVRS